MNQTPSKRIFDRYMFADYSGGGEDNKQQQNIALVNSTHQTEPHLLEPPPPDKHFSRQSLTDFFITELKLATNTEQRVLFGFDHQYGWPKRLRQHANVDGLGWRETIKRLAEGEDKTNFPSLDIPLRYCRKFNNYSGTNSFWSPLKNRANSYGISNESPDESTDDRFRLTEQVPPLQGNAKPKPADAVGGMGEGIVGGQTICGLRQIARMLDITDIAWWPFDGLDITSDWYDGKHVGVEIYPSALRRGKQISDVHDAMASCWAVMDADDSGELQRLMTLQVPETYAARIRVEGWIIGMDPRFVDQALTQTRTWQPRKKSRVRKATETLPNYRCPISGCKKTFYGSRGGWDSHIASLSTHPSWRQDLTTGKERKDAFKKEFPDFFRS